MQRKKLKNRTVNIIVIDFKEKVEYHSRIGLKKLSVLCKTGLLNMLNIMPE
jgi:hypothetical protein